jgi:hypothetical protein
VISVDLAQRLQAAGLAWTPAAGDRFVVPGRGIDDQAFVLSDMTVEVHDLPTGPIIGFNGTTEWALDSLEMREVVWLPREAQLREALGESFLRLEAVPGGFAVVTCEGGDTGVQQRHVDLDAEDSYARALLARLETGTSSTGP